MTVMLDILLYHQIGWTLNSDTLCFASNMLFFRIIRYLGIGIQHLVQKNETKEEKRHLQRGNGHERTTGKTYEGNGDVMVVTGYGNGDG